MNGKSTAIDWMAIGTNVAVVVGLVLVVLELNQNSELARLELVNDHNSMENELILATMESAPKEAIAKSIECPEKLDLSDYVVIDAYLYTGMNLVYRDYELAKEGFFTEKDWKSEVDNYAHWYLSGEFGTSYWNNVGRNYFDAEFVEYVESVLAKPGVDIGVAWRKIATALPSKKASASEISSVCS